MNDEVARAAAQVLVDAQWPEGTFARSLSCQEAENVADFIGGALGPEPARDFIQAHSLDDKDGDAHVEIGRITRIRGIGWTADPVAR